MNKGAFFYSAHASACKGGHPQTALLLTVSAHEVGSCGHKAEGAGCHL